MGNDRYAVGDSLVDSQLNSLFADGLAETAIAIDHSKDLGFRDCGDRLVGFQVAPAQPVDVAGYADDTVAVVASKVGGGQVPGDSVALFGAAAGLDKDLADQSAKGVVVINIANSEGRPTGGR